jgi:hypothetical protein
MKLDTESTIYVCTDRNNAEVRLLIPTNLLKGIEVVELNLSDPDPDSTDAAEHKLLSQEMAEMRFDV